jgi:hypothetical protein
VVGARPTRGSEAAHARRGAAYPAILAKLPGYLTHSAADLAVVGSLMLSNGNTEEQFEHSEIIGLDFRSRCVHITRCSRGRLETLRRDKPRDMPATLLHEGRTREVRENGKLVK